MTYFIMAGYWTLNSKLAIFHFKILFVILETFSSNQGLEIFRYISEQRAWKKQELIILPNNSQRKHIQYRSDKSVGQL